MCFFQEKWSRHVTAPRFILVLFTLLSFRLFRFLHCLPLLELPLAFLGFVVGDNVGKYAPSNWFNDVLRNTGIVYGFASTAHKFWSLRVVLNFQGTSVGVWMGVGRWQTSFSIFDYQNHRGLMSVPPGDQVYKQNADTRQECLHRSYSVALLLYHRSKMLSIELGT